MAASSGIGTTAIQIAAALGARVFATAGSDEKCAACVGLGAERAINYRTEDFVEILRAEGGANLILDMVGGPYLPRNVKALADDGRLVQIAFLQGPKVELNFAEVMMRRLTITGSTLRPQSDLAKAGYAAELERHVWPMIGAGQAPGGDRFGVPAGARGRGPCADGKLGAYREDRAEGGERLELSFPVSPAIGEAQDDDSVRLDHECNRHAPFEPDDPQVLADVSAEMAAVRGTPETDAEGFDAVDVAARHLWPRRPCDPVEERYEVVLCFGRENHRPGRHASQAQPCRRFRKSAKTSEAGTARSGCSCIAS